VSSSSSADQNPAPLAASLPRQDAVMEDDALLRTAADRLEALATRTTAGDWRTGGLLATRPEVIAHREGGTEHVAEARAGTAAWITALSPAVAPPLAAWLRATAAASDIDPAAVAVARALLERLPPPAS
jgi:hypothetical protein